MFAVVETGGKQYKVQANQLFKVEKLVAEPGQVIELSNVLAVHDGSKLSIGAPNVKGASVKAEIIAHEKADKVLIFKKRRRHNYRRKRGHRQLETVVKVLEIKG